MKESVIQFLLDRNVSRKILIEEKMAKTHISKKIIAFGAATTIHLNEMVTSLNIYFVLIRVLTTLNAWSVLYYAPINSRNETIRD